MDIEQLRARVKPADEFFAAGRFDDAIEILLPMAAEGVDYFRPYFNLGYMYRLKGATDTAIRYLDIAVAKLPAFAEAWFTLGQAHLDRGDPAAAHAALAEAVRLAPDNLRFANWLARTLWLLKRPDEAAALVRDAAARIGWHTPARCALTFSQEPWFLTHIANWRNHLAPILGRVERSLEIGCMEGMSAIWTVEHLLAPGGTLFANDIEFRPNFLGNVAAAGVAGRLVTMHGSSEAVLPALAAESFDFVYVDGDHTPQGAFRDAVNAVALVRRGGFIVLDDYGKANESTQTGLDLFMALYALGIEILDKRYQVYLRRTEAPLALAPEARALLGRALDRPSLVAFDRIADDPAAATRWLRDGRARFGGA